MNNFNYSIAQDYFRSRKWAVVTSVILLLIGVFTITLFVGVILIGLAIWGFWWSTQKTKLQKVLDEIKEKVESTIVEKASTELGLDIEQCKEIDPVVLQEVVYKNDYNFWYAYNEEDVFSSIYRFSVILFSETQIYYYVYTFSLISNEENTLTGEYFYRDIVAFNTANKLLEYSYNSHPYKKNYQEFTIVTTGGTVFSSAINNNDMTKIQGMRQLLREKKNAMV